MSWQAGRNLSEWGKSNYTVIESPTAESFFLSHIVQMEKEDLSFIAILIRSREIPFQQVVMALDFDLLIPTFTGPLLNVSIVRLRQQPTLLEVTVDVVVGNLQDLVRSQRL
jgi:hypothetical protein